MRNDLHVPWQQTWRREEFSIILSADLGSILEKWMVDIGTSHKTKKAFKRHTATEHTSVLVTLNRIFRFRRASVCSCRELKGAHIQAVLRLVGPVNSDEYTRASIQEQFV